MSTRSALAAGIVLAAALTGTSAWAQSANLGQSISPADFAAWDITIAPDGTGLPAGSGTAKQGAVIFAGKCQACHGQAGAGKPADPLVGGAGTLTSPRPLRTVGSYWPWATTVFDYIRRAMPFTAPQSLTHDEVYAVSAYLLYLNGIIAEDAVLDATSLPQIKMPNRAGFVNAWRPAR